MSLRSDNDRRNSPHSGSISKGETLSKKVWKTPVLKRLDISLTAGKNASKKDVDGWNKS